MAYSTCVRTKQYGGLGLLDIERLADKLAAKWIIRIFLSNDVWSCLLHRSCHKFPIKGRKSWSGFTPLHMVFANVEFTPKGSELVQGLWGSWFKFKKQFKIREGIRYVEAILPHDSIWFSAFLPQLDRSDFGRAHKLARLGFLSWKHLFEGKQLLHLAGLQELLNFSRPCLRLLQVRTALILQIFPWFQNTDTGTNPILVGCWGKGSALLPLPNLVHTSGNLVHVLNARWKLSWNLKQWVYRFKSIWAFKVLLNVHL